MRPISPLPFKPPRLLGLSEALLADHYNATYGHRVQQLNALMKHIESLDWQTEDPNRLLTLHAERDTLTNEVALHEVYFDCLGGEDGLGSAAVEPTDELADAINQSFGSYAQWQQQFVSLAHACRQPGWLVMNWSAQTQTLSLQFLEHNSGSQCAAIPVMGIDLFEHAYEADYGTDRAAYIAAFMRNLHWDRPLQRLRSSKRLAIDDTLVENDACVSPEALATMISDGVAVQVLDVCLKDDIPKRYDTLPKAIFRQAEAIDDWIDDLPKDTPVIAYCMYGFQVSANAVQSLQRHGHPAKKLAGGIASWRALGLPTIPLEQ